MLKSLLFNSSEYKLYKIYNTFTIRIFILILYIFFCLIFFFPSNNQIITFFETLTISSLSLWFGLISIIGSNGQRRLYDPATFFNLGLFYYCFKGFSISLDIFPNYLQYIPYRNIIDNYHIVSLITLVSIFAWNGSYYLITSKHKKIINNYLSPKKYKLIKLPGFYLLLFVAIFSTLMFLRLTNFDLGYFLAKPGARGYMSDEQIGIGSPYAFFYYYGMLFLSVVSVAWLAIIGSQGKKPGILCWSFSIITFIIIFATSPRAALIAYIVSNIIVYHLLIKPINPFFISSLGIIGLFYIYLVNTWRHIVGRMDNPDVSSGFIILVGRTNIKDFLLNTLYGTDLSDIRVFVFLSDIYGKILPLKNGETILRIITQLIPRFLWPSKPEDLGIEIGQLIMTGTRSGTPPGFLAEMYMNFNFLGVIICSALLGFLIGYIYKNWIINTKNLKYILFYAVVVPRLFLIPSSTFANVITSLIIFLLGINLIFFKGRMK